MQIRTSHLVIAGLVLAGAGLVTVDRLGTTHEAAPQTAVVDRHATDEARLARIEAALSALSAARASEGGNARPSEPAGERSRPPLSPALLSNEHPQPLTTEESLEAADRQEREVFALLDTAVSAEKADPRWSTFAAEEITTGLPSATMEHSQVSDVRCQTSLCRLEATHANQNSEHEFMMSLGQLSSFRNGEAFLMRAPREDGRMATTIFISRAGQRLPVLQ